MIYSFPAMPNDLSEEGQFEFEPKKQTMAIQFVLVEPGSTFHPRHCFMGGRAHKGDQVRNRGARMPIGTLHPSTFFSGAIAGAVSARAPRKLCSTPCFKALVKPACCQTGASLAQLVRA